MQVCHGAEYRVYLRILRDVVTEVGHGRQPYRINPYPLEVICVLGNTYAETYQEVTYENSPLQPKLLVIMK